MSIVTESESGWIISHTEFFSEIPVSPEPSSGMSISLFRLNPALFEIISPFVRRRKRGHRHTANSADDDSEVSACPKEVKALFAQLVDIGRTKNIFVQENPGQEGNRNAGSRQAANQFYKEMNLDFIEEKLTFHGANPSNVGFISKIKEHSFIFPSKTTFYCGHIHEVIQKHFTVDKASLFDLILMDPPWKNKFIWRNKKRRLHEGGGYELIDNSEIENIPIEHLCAKDALVVVWSTNAEAHQKTLVNRIFPKWHVSYLTTWYWVKVTQSGESICPFNSTGKKQPYEAIMIGRHTPVERTRPPITGRNFSLDSTSSDLQRTKVILSLPSSLHSHKPPLIKILSTYLPKDPKCCELFARYLIPGFTSIGNEVLKLQHSSLYLNS